MPLRRYALLLGPILVASLAGPIAAAQLAKAVPSQSQVASKTAKFATISATSPDVKKALDSKNLAGGLKLAGKTGSFVGVVDAAYSPRGNREIFLDFSKPYKDTISAVLFAKNFSKFPDLQTLKGKKVLVSGKFDAYGGSHPEIALESPGQIKIVKG